MKSVARVFLLVLFGTLVAPLALPVRWSKPIDRRDHVFQFGSHVVSLMPGLPGVYVRRAFYLLVLPWCDSDVTLEFGTLLAQRDTEIGKRVYVGAFCNIGMCRIGNDVLIGSNVDIVSGQRVHATDDPEKPIREQSINLEKVSIGKGSWIGNRSVIMADIGQHAVVGAGSVVTRPCGEYTVNAGNPARTIRHRLKTDVESPVPFRDIREARG